MIVRWYWYFGLGAAVFAGEGTTFCFCGTVGVVSIRPLVFVFVASFMPSLYSGCHIYPAISLGVFCRVMNGKDAGMYMIFGGR